MGTQFLSLLLATLLVTQCSKIDPDKLLTVEEQHQDFDLMVDILNEACPVLNTYRSENEIQDHFSTSRQKLNSPATMLDFYLNVTQTLAFFQDGHLQSYASNDFYAAINQLNGFLPLKLKFIDGDIYISNNLAAHPGLKEGTKITSINSTKTNQILSDLYRNISSDMDNVHFKTHKLNNEHRLYISYYFRFPEEYTVEVSGQDRPITLKAVSGGEYSTLINQSDKKEVEKKLFSINYDEENATAIFQFTTFGDREGEDELRAILDDLVKQCEEKNISDLVIDIRGNTGGFDGNAAIIYSYLTDTTFQALSGRYLKTKELSFLEHVLNKDVQQTLNKVPMNKSGEEFKLTMPLDQPFQSNASNYSGRVYLLTDNSTFSTAGLFTSIFRNHKRGAILGDNTGGGYQGDSGGIAYVELPNSKLTLFLPLVRNEYFYDTSLNSDSFEPDEKVELSISDFLNQNDPTLERAFELISQNRIKF